MNNISINIFIKKYLPDYERRCSLFRDEQYINSINDIYKSQLEIDILFINKYFQEALENYTNIVCEKQRGIIAEINHANIKCDMITTSLEIMEAPHPKIEEL